MFVNLHRERKQSGLYGSNKLSNGSTLLITHNENSSITRSKAELVNALKIANLSCLGKMFVFRMLFKMSPLIWLYINQSFNCSPILRPSMPTTVMWKYIGRGFAFM